MKHNMNISNIFHIMNKKHLSWKGNIYMNNPNEIYIDPFTSIRVI